MNKEFQKAIYIRNRLRNTFWRQPSKEYAKTYKIQINKCVSLQCESIKNYLKKVYKKAIESNKGFFGILLR